MKTIWLPLLCKIFLLPSLGEEEPNHYLNWPHKMFVEATAARETLRGLSHQTTAALFSTGNERRHFSGVLQTWLGWAEGTGRTGLHWDNGQIS